MGVDSPPVERGDGSDPAGVDDSGRDTVGRVMSALVPQPLARWALSVSVTTDRERYTVGDDVAITVELRNRLPVPITVATAGGRLWGWTVDGEIEASDEPRRRSAHHSSIELRGFERRRFERTWDGRFKRTGSPTRWIEADPGEYEIGAYVATRGEPVRDATTVRLRR